MLAEGFLDDVELAVLCQPLDGEDFGPFGLNRQNRARLHRETVHMDDTGPALAGVAADMRAGEAQLFADVLNQQGARFDVGSDGFAVHRHGHGGHRWPPGYDLKQMRLESSPRRHWRQVFAFGGLSSTRGFGPARPWRRGDWPLLEMRTGSPPDQTAVGPSSVRATTRSR